MTINATEAVIKSSAATAMSQSFLFAIALLPFASTESSSHFAASSALLRAVAARKPFLC